MKRFQHCGLLLLLILLHHAVLAQQNSWIATWSASPQALDPSPDDPLHQLENQTVRERVRVSIGGSQLCIRLSNESATTPLMIGAATVAVPTSPTRIRPDSLRTITFSGQKSITIPAGAPVLSDPVPFPVAPGAEISISLYLPRRVSALTGHSLALKQAAVSRGDQTRTETIDGSAHSDSSIVVSAVLVPARPSQHLVVAFGDSITDGDGSTPETDHTWPSDLYRRLAKTSLGSTVSVINEGIAGNRLLGDGFGANALARFDRDALALPGVTHILLLEGINDISFPGAKLGDSYLADPADIRTSEDLIAAYRQLILRAHTHGVKLIGATITPCEGVDLPGYYSESKEAIRQAVNKWIRTSGAFDGVVDFDAVLRDPTHPSRLLPRFASQDHLHPNDLGYQAMADAIDLVFIR